jgi:carbon storage regulator CsrA
MLVLSRKKDESIVIELEDGRTITITVCSYIHDVARQKVGMRIGIEAEPTIGIHREEVWYAILKNRLAKKHEESQ